MRGKDVIELLSKNINLTIFDLRGSGGKNGSLLIRGRKSTSEEKRNLKTNLEAIPPIEASLFAEMVIDYTLYRLQ
ncbi:23770_t:CDS:2 [Gigaspora margarita]|uniref:23770_t:CDS:1 n=1 Tax=Gigaspora margarita TaxID=4874 RepID=A0ABM8W091_GIGMA|nr:23770_t:CDS:2 [Gigaspora margarita]